jgi:DedD protein
MEEKNELNDIILNRSGGTNNNKKIILAVATLGVILIIVVMLMNSISSNGTDNLPQAVLPPKPELQSAQVPTQDEPLFEDVKVIKDENQDSNNLDQIAKKLKQESQDTPVVKEETAVVPETVSKPEVTKTAQKVAAPEKESVPAPKSSATGSGYYIQVGSFSKYEPNKKFLKSITDKGYSYEYRGDKKNPASPTKVLVGPFKAEKDARDALKIIRNSVEPGAFLTKI